MKDTIVLEQKEQEEKVNVTVIVNAHRLETKKQVELVGNYDK